MSVRIHAIAKETNKTGKEVLEILVERGYDVKSASSTIDNITAQSLIDEFNKDSSTTNEAEVPEKEQAKDKPEAKEVPFVKTKQDLDREKEEKEKAEQAEKDEAALARQESVPSQPEPVIVEKESGPSTAGAAPSLPPPPVKSAGAPPPLPFKSAPPPVPQAPATSTDDSAGIVEGNLIIVKPPIVVRDFAVLIGLKPFQLISELMEMGIFASMNQTIEEDVASKLAKSKGFELEIRHRGEKAEPQVKKEKVKVDENDEKFLKPRPPIVCILGHVDHGKTTLLDTIRKANVVGGEAGGITQHVGAYQIEHNNQKITFLDTPGHAAFSKIRERGANLTDVSILVVAADDGFMPQTEEALKFAQRSQSSLMVAINKTDAKGA
ncbi:MAG: GTP-binding protein, partial [Opitutae bacterium]|nr:GTP-binding protein [Opitutae bacterium]